MGVDAAPGFLILMFRIWRKCLAGAVSERVQNDADEE